MTEETDSALADRELVEESHVVNQKVEQPDLVHEPDSNVETVWVYGHTVDLLLKPLGKLHSK